MSLPCDMLPGALRGADPLFRLGKIPCPLALLQPPLLHPSLAQASKLPSLVPAVPLGAVFVLQLLQSQLELAFWKLLALQVTSKVPRLLALQGQAAVGFWGWCSGFGVDSSES